MTSCIFQDILKDVTKTNGTAVTIAVTDIAAATEPSIWWGLSGAGT